MILATRLSAVWQVAGVAAAALCCYLVSQSVAAERAGLIKVDRQIAQTHDDIAKLQTEIGVRGRMGQLERWNIEVLALQAPRPSQFVANGVQLASLYGRRGQPALRLDPTIVAQQGAVSKVAYQPAPPQAQPMPAPAAPALAASAPDVAPSQPLLRNATFVRPSTDRIGGMPSGVPASSAPLMQRASFELARPVAASKTAPKAAAPVRIARADPVKSLLPDDIGQLAAREARGSRDSFKAAR